MEYQLWQGSDITNLIVQFERANDTVQLMLMKNRPGSVTPKPTLPEFANINTRCLMKSPSTEFVQLWQGSDITNFNIKFERASYTLQLMLMNHRPGSVTPKPTLPEFANVNTHGLMKSPSTEFVQRWQGSDITNLNIKFERANYTVKLMLMKHRPGSVTRNQPC